MLFCGRSEKRRRSALWGKNKGALLLGMSLSPVRDAFGEGLGVFKDEDVGLLPSKELCCPWLPFPRHSQAAPRTFSSGICTEPLRPHVLLHHLNTRPWPEPPAPGLARNHMAGALGSPSCLPLLFQVQGIMEWSEGQEGINGVGTLGAACWQRENWENCFLAFLLSEAAEERACCSLPGQEQ